MYTCYNHCHRATAHLQLNILLLLLLLLLLLKNIPIYLRKVVLNMKVVALRRKVATALCATHSFATLFTGAHKSTQSWTKQIKPKSATIFYEYIRFEIDQLSTAHLILSNSVQHIWYCPTQCSTFDIVKLSTAHLILSNSVEHIWYCPTQYSTFDIVQLSTAHLILSNSVQHIWYCPTQYSTFRSSKDCPLVRLCTFQSYWCYWNIKCTAELQQ
jgi:hypothetical protein